MIEPQPKPTPSEIAEAVKAAGGKPPGNAGKPIERVPGGKPAAQEGAKTAPTAPTKEPKSKTAASKEQKAPKGIESALTALGVTAQDAPLLAGATGPRHEAITKAVANIEVAHNSGDLTVERLIQIGISLRGAMGPDVADDQRQLAYGLRQAILKTIENKVGVRLSDQAARVSQDPKVQNKVGQLEQATQALMGTESGMARKPPIKLYDETTDTINDNVVQGKNLKAALEGHQKMLDLTDDLQDREHKLRDMLEDLVNGSSRQVKQGHYQESRYNETETGEYIDRARKMLRETKQRIDNQRQREYKAQRELHMSQLELMQWEKDIINEYGPEAFIDYWLASVYAKPEDAGVEETAQRRLRLAEETYYRSPTFKKSKYYKNLQGELDLSDKEMDTELAYELTAQWRRHEEKHLQLKVAYTYFHRAERNFEDVIKVIDDFGSEGWHHVYNARGGLNGHAMQIYIEELEALRRGDDDRVRRLGPQDFILAEGAAYTRLKAEKEQWAKSFKNATGRELEEGDIRFATSAGRMLAAIRQKTALALLRALGPAEISLFNEYPEYMKIFDKIRTIHGENTFSFADAGPEEIVAAVMDVYRFFMEKWSNLSPGQQRMLMYVGEFVSLQTGLDQSIDRQIAEWKTSGLYEQKKNKLLDKYWGEKHKRFGIFSYRGKWVETGHTPMLSEDAEFRRLLVMDAGVRKLFTEILDMYDHDSSGWRGGLVLTQVHGLFVNAEDRALGYSLRRIGYRYLTAKSGKAAEDIFEYGSEDECNNRKDYMDLGEGISLPSWGADPEHGRYGLSVRAVLGKIAQFMPHMSADLLSERHHEGFEKWWRSQETQDLAKEFVKKGLLGYSIEQRAELQGEGLLGYSVAHRKIMRTAYLIDQRLVYEGLSRLDYTLELDSIPGNIRDIVNDVMNTVDGRDNAVELYLKLMRGLAQTVGGNEQIIAFKRAEYRPYFSRTLWTKDAYFEILEQPKKFAGRGTIFQPRAKERFPLTFYMTKHGSGGRDPLARSWRDLGVFGMKIINMVRTALSMDDKQFFESINEIVNNQEIYAGKPSALRGVLWITTGREKFSKTDYPLAFFGLHELPNSSEAKRYFGWEGRSVDLKDIHETYEQLDKTFSKLELYEELKPIVEKALKHVGIAMDSLLVKDKITKLPFWAHQARIAILIISILLAVEALKSGSSVLGSQPQSHAPAS